jgi:hypothetical protein
MEQYISMKNHEGYPDPTAGEAITNVERDKKKNTDDRLYKTIGCILRVCELAGYSVEERIVLKDVKTGKVYK